MADADIASLAIRIESLEAKQAAKDLKDLEAQGKKTEQAVHALTSAFKTLGITFSAAYFGKFIKSGIDALDTLNDLSLKTGIVATKLAGMQLAAKQSGTSIDTFAHSLNLLSVNMANNGQAFAKLGITARDPLEAFYQLVGVLEQIQDPQTRAAVGAQALGRGWQELAPLMANGVGELKKAVEEGEKLSGVTVQATKDADAFNDQVEIMTGWLGSLSVRLMGPVLEGFNQLAAKIREATALGINFNNVMAGISNFVFDTGGLRTMSASIDEINNKIVKQKEKVATVGKGGFLSDLLGEDVGLEKNKLDGLLKEREKIIKDYHESTKKVAVETTKETAKIEESAVKQFIGIQEQKSKAASGHAATVKSATKSIIRDQKDELDNLIEQHKRLTLSERDYYLQSDAVKKLSFAKQQMAAIQYDMNQAAEKEKDVNDAKKSEMDELIDKYNQLTLSARDYYKTKLEGEKIKGSAQEPLLQQFDKNVQTESNKKAIDDSRAALEEYVNTVDTAKSSMDDLSASATNVFDASLGGANQLVGVFNNMLSAIKENEKSLVSLGEKKKAIDKFKPQGLEDELLLIDAKKKNELDYQVLQQKTVDNYLNGTVQMAGAAAALFEDNKDAQLAAQAVALVTLGIQAVQAIVTQGQGDPYTAFARIAAMAAIVGSMVASVGGNSPGATGSAPVQKYTGTVLGGGKDAESNSVGNVYELLKTIHAEEYTELRGINRGVSDLKGGIENTVTKIFQTGGIKDIATLMKSTYMGSGFMKDPVQNLLSKFILGVTSEKVVGGGISTGAFQAGSDVQGQQYSTIEKTKKSLFFKKTSYRTEFSDLDQGVEDALTSVFTSMSQTMFGIAGNLGKAIGKDIGVRVSNYIVPAMQIELRGLSGEEAAKKLNGVISAALDTMAGAVFGDIIGQYQKLGEGMLETAIRIVSEVAVVKDALSQSGMSMGENAIELADSLVQAAGGLEQFQQQFEAFYDKFFSDVEKQDRLQTRLSETMREVFLILPGTREEYRKILESLQLTNPLDRERYSLMLQLSSAADQYYSAIENGNDSIANSQSARYDQEIQWLKLTGDAAGALAMERQREYDAMDASLVPMQKIINQYQDLMSTVETAYRTAADMLTSTFTKFFNLAKSLNEYRKSLIVGELSGNSPERQYKLTKSIVDNTKDIINKGPGKTEASQLKFANALEEWQGVSTDFLKASRDYNASNSQYFKDLKLVTVTTKTGANKALDVASDAEKQLNALNEMVSEIKGINMTLIKIDGTLGTLVSTGQKIKESTDKSPKATDLLRTSINSDVGLSGKIKGVNSEVKGLNNESALGGKIKDLNKDSGIKGAVSSVYTAVSALNKETGIKGAVGSVGDAIAGLKAAVIAMNKLQADRDKATKDARAAEVKAAAERAKAQDALDTTYKNQVFAKVVGKTDLNAMTWHAKNAGLDEAASAAVGKGWADWSKGMIGSLDLSKSTGWFDRLNTLTDDFRAYLTASAQGLDYNGHNADYYKAKFAELQNSHANGLSYVPFDGYMAKLHQGEKVVTAFEAKRQEDTKRILEEVVVELKIANRQRAAGTTELIKKANISINNATAQTRAIKRLDVA